MRGYTCITNTCGETQGNAIIATSANDRKVSDFESLGAERKKETNNNGVRQSSRVKLSMKKELRQDA